METQELELLVSPEELCRTCLAAVDRMQLKPIFCNDILDGKIVPFPKVVELATGEKLTRDEKLPNNVCTECKTKLREFYTFVQKVQKSSNLLYEIFTVAKPETRQSIGKKIETTNTEVQTDPTVEELPAAPSVATVENGTQCEANTLTLAPSAEAACQTDALPESKTSGIQNVCLNNIAAPQKDDDQMAIVPVKIQTAISLAREHTHGRADDGAQSNDEDEFEMVLVGDDTQEEEEDCFILEKVNHENKSANDTHNIDVPLNSKRSFQDIVGSTSAGEKQEQKRNCEYCKFSGRNENYLSHFQVHRQTLDFCFESIDYYRCANCFMVFLSETNFESHSKESCQPVLADDYIECADLNTHELFYLNGLDVCLPKMKTFRWVHAYSRYRCAKCLKHSSSFEDMKIHCQSHDADDEKREDVSLLWKENSLDRVHVCGLCEAHFPDALYIRQHLYFHQSSFFCPYGCPMSFRTFLSLTKHLYRTHMQNIKVKVVEPPIRDTQYPCEVCGRAFHNKVALQTHTKKHFRERKYMCTVCKKCFGQKSDLTTHSRIHTDERPYACELCSKTFRTTSHRRDHMSTHEFVNRFECDVCQKLFKAERILVGHKRLHTGEKPFQCDKCEKTFMRKHHLKLHSKTHCKKDDKTHAD